jgi:hypothetical protein
MLTMKKAKIILTAVGILAIVGGAAAFKAKRALIPFAVPNAQGLCLSTTSLRYTTDPLDATAPGTFTITASTTTAAVPCPTIAVYPFN